MHVSGVPAYSTLGYFDDPVLSTFIRYREAELARLMFHELAHQVVYVKDDTAFNESFAVAVEEEGLAALARGAAADEPDAAQLAADVARAPKVRADFRSLVRATRDRLAALYASGAIGRATKRAGKAAAFAAMRDGLRTDEGRLGTRCPASTAGSRPAPTTRESSRRGCMPIACRSSPRCSRRKAATCRASTPGSRRWPRCRKAERDAALAALPPATPSPSDRVSRGPGRDSPQ